MHYFVMGLLKIQARFIYLMIYFNGYLAFQVYSCHP